MIFIVCQALLSLSPPYFIKRIVDVLAVSSGSLRELWKFTGVLLGVLVGILVLQIMQGKLSAPLSVRIMHDIRIDFYESIQRLHMKRRDRLPTGALVSRLIGDTNALGSFLMDIAVWILPNILLTIGICVALFVLCRPLALATLLPLPLIAIPTYWLFRGMQSRYARATQRQIKMSARAHDSIGGVRIAKAFGREDDEVRELERQSLLFCNDLLAAEHLAIMFFPILRFAVAAGVVLILALGGMSVMGHTSVFSRLTMGSLVAYLVYVSMLAGPAGALATSGKQVSRALAGARRSFEIIDADQEVYDPPQAEPMRSTRGEVEFVNVRFGYSPGQPVLDGVGFRASPGEFIGLVGNSGIGKTTLLSLISRFYDVDEGCILLDGRDVRRIRLRDLRRQIAIVPQDPYLFNTTIAHNIAYAVPTASFGEVVRAAITANAHDFIMHQPDAYDTIVGERGLRLSGGQRQLISIARAILSDRKILILDEATSSVDTETESLIQEALLRAMQGRTVFAAAHRLSTLRHADRLLVIQDGRITEQGSHDELMDNKGSYYELVTRQSQTNGIPMAGDLIG
jgi:ATP-binding cassette, subfamily B, bacterial